MADTKIAFLTAHIQLNSKKVAIPEGLYSLTQLKLGGGRGHFNYSPFLLNLVNYMSMSKKIRLSDICHGRSGDKGEAANIGLIAYRKEDYEVIKEKVTAEAVKRYFDGICFGPVERYEMPNINALNFVLHNTLGGGGTVSLKNDAQGKTLASALLMMEIEI